MSAWPPQRKHDPLPVPQEFALKMLSQYITDTETKPYLLPNARLEASGPTAGSSNSIIIRNLQRVEAGLKGEWLAPVVDLEVAVAEGINEKKDDAAEGWQNLEDYQLEQEDLDGEVAPETTAVQQDGDNEEGDIEYGEDQVDAPAPGPRPLKRKNEVTDSEPKAKKPRDKEARKLEKKEKLKREKREKEEKRKAAQQAQAEESE